MNTGHSPILRPELIDALTQLELAAGAMSKVTHPALDLLGDDPLVIMEFARWFEAVRHQLGRVDRHIVRTCDASQAAKRLAQRNTATLLARGLRLSSSEAGRRVRASAGLEPRCTPLGAPLEPRYPTLAHAVDVGDVSAENADVVIRGLDSLHRLAGMDSNDLERAESDLTAQASVFRPEDLRTCVSRLIDCYNPDGQVERDQKEQALRQLRLIAHRDGGYSIVGRLTGAVGAQLVALLSPMARPRPADPAPVTDRAVTDRAVTDRAVADSPTATCGSGTAPPSAAARRLAEVRRGRDERDHGQRMHDALADLVSRASRAGGLPASGGTPATIIVTIGLDELLERFGHGMTSDRTLLSVAEILRLADEAEIIPTVFSRAGAVLAQGRACRIATKAQSLALIARDGGCSFPDCDHPPEWSQRHHVQAWVDGGATDVDNLTLLCGYHHRSFEQRGWACRMINSLPHWIPPRWIDSHQTPMLHHRLQLRHRGAQPGAC